MRQLRLDPEPALQFRPNLSASAASASAIVSPALGLDDERSAMSRVLRAPRSRAVEVQLRISIRSHHSRRAHG